MVDSLIEPNLGFSGFHLHLGNVAGTEGALAETVAGAALGSAEGTLPVNAQRAFTLNEAVRVTAKARLGWSHEFTDNATRVSASFAGLRGSGFGLDRAPIGCDVRPGRLGCRPPRAILPVTHVPPLRRFIQRQPQRPIIHSWVRSWYS